MKKLFLSLTLLASIIGSIDAATLRITNNAKYPIWARVNNQKLLPGELSAPPFMTALRIGGAIFTLGLTEAEIAIMRVATDQITAFLQINPGKQRFFDSGFSPIKKVTFIRPVQYEETLISPGKLLDATKPYTNRYELFETKVHDKGAKLTSWFGSQKFTFIDDEKIKVIGRFPIVEELVVKPGIGTFIVEARMTYNSPKNIRRGNKKLSIKNVSIKQPIILEGISKAADYRNIESYQ